MAAATAYRQAHDFVIEVFVKPPKEKFNRTVYWRLAAAAASLADSGQSRYPTSDAVLTATFGLTELKIETILFLKKTPKRIN